MIEPKDCMTYEGEYKRGRKEVLDEVEKILEEWKGIFRALSDRDEIMLEKIKSLHSSQETEEILNNPEAMKAINAHKERMKTGDFSDYIPLKDLRVNSSQVCGYDRTKLQNKNPANTTHDGGQDAPNLVSPKKELNHSATLIRGITDEDKEIELIELLSNTERELQKVREKMRMGR